MRRARWPLSLPAMLACLLSACLLCGLATRAQAQAYRLRELATAAESAPKSASAQAAYAEALLRAGDTERARSRFELAATLRKQSPEALYDVARAVIAGGNYARSKAACRRLEKAYPGHPLADTCLAAAHLSERRASQALPLLAAVLERSPQLVEAKVRQADAQLQSGQLASAGASYQALLKGTDLTPAQRARVLLGKGRLAQLMGDEGAAQSAFAEAVQIDPDQPELQLLLGSVTTGEPSVGALRRALSGRPGYPEAEVLLIRRLLAMGRFADAHYALTRAAKENASRRLLPDLESLRGRALLGLERFPEAEEALTAALAESPTDGLAALALADLYARTDRPEEALSQYETASALLPADATPLLSAARLSLSLSRPTHAVGLLRLAERRHGDRGEVHAALGDALVAQGNAAGAIEAYRKALSLPQFASRQAVAAKLAGLQAQR